MHLFLLWLCALNVEEQGVLSIVCKSTNMFIPCTPLVLLVCSSHVMLWLCETLTCSTFRKPVFSPQSASYHAGWGRGKTITRISVSFTLVCAHLYFFSRKSWKPRWRDLKWSRSRGLQDGPKAHLLSHRFWGIHCLGGWVVRPKASPLAFTLFCLCFAWIVSSVSVPSVSLADRMNHS